MHTEATRLAKEQRLASCHTSSIALRRHAWLRSSGITEDARSCIEELPFNGSGLFNEKTDELMGNLHKIRKTAKSLFIYLLSL